MRSNKRCKKRRILLVYCHQEGASRQSPSADPDMSAIRTIETSSLGVTFHCSARRNNADRVRRVGFWISTETLAAWAVCRLRTSRSFSDHVGVSPICIMGPKLPLIRRTATRISENPPRSSSIGPKGIDRYLRRSWKRAEEARFGGA